MGKRFGIKKIEYHRIYIKKVNARVAKTVKSVSFKYPLRALKIVPPEEVGYFYFASQMVILLLTVIGAAVISFKYPQSKNRLIQLVFFEKGFKNLQKNMSS